MIAAVLQGLRSELIKCAWFIIICTGAGCVVYRGLQARSCSPACPLERNYCDCSQAAAYHCVGATGTVCSLTAQRACIDVSPEEKDAYVIELERGYQEAQLALVATGVEGPALEDMLAGSTEMALSIVPDGAKIYCDDRRDQHRVGGGQRRQDACAGRSGTPCG